MADAMTFRATPGLTAYVRIRTSATTSIAVALVEGTGGAVGWYTVSEAALVSAGLTVAGTYACTAFQGTPSTTANDFELGVAELAWTGSAVDPGGGGGGSTTTQPRVNKRAGAAFRLRVSSRDDGTHEATKPVRLQAGLVGDIAVSIDMSPLFGQGIDVLTVGTPSISGGSIVATELGPRDHEAMIELSGSATAEEEQTISVPVTMETNESVTVDIRVEVFAA